MDGGDLGASGIDGEVGGCGGARSGGDGRGEGQGDGRGTHGDLVNSDGDGFGESRDDKINYSTEGKDTKENGFEGASLFVSSIGTFEKGFFLFHDFQLLSMGETVRHFVVYQASLELSHFL